MRLLDLSFGKQTNLSNLKFGAFSQELFLRDNTQWITGGIYLTSPASYKDDFKLTVLVCVLDEAIIINSSPIEFFVYLQYVAGCLLKNDKFPVVGEQTAHDRLNNSLRSKGFSFSDHGGSYNPELGTKKVVKQSPARVDLELSGDYVIFGFVQQDVSDGWEWNTFTVKVHKYVFVTEVMRLQKQFEHAVQKHDKELFDLVGHERFTQIVQTNSLIKTPEEHFSLTERYFANDLPTEYVASYPWYNLEKLFTEYLQKNNLTMQDVEDIIRKEEEKWKKENPDKMLATETIKFVKEKTNPLFFWKK